MLTAQRVVKPSLMAQEILEVQPMTLPSGLFEFDYLPKEMEMRALQGMKVEAKASEVLQGLMDNRKEHIKIVAEAKEGYLKRVEEELTKTLADVRAGKMKPTESIRINLTPPVDHTKVYDRAIKMMEMETRNVIELTQEQVGCLMMDEWEWKDDFIGSNALYSARARDMER